MRIMHGVAEAMELNHSQELQRLQLTNQQLEAVSGGRAYGHNRAWGFEKRAGRGGVGCRWIEPTAHSQPAAGGSDLGVVNEVKVTV